jgi:FtsZ-binding cell division protein ZapB
MGFHLLKQLVMKIFGIDITKLETIKKLELELKELEEHNIKLQQELRTSKKRIKVRNKKIKELQQIIAELTTTSQVAATVSSEIKAATAMRENKNSKITRKMAFITKLPVNHEMLSDPNVLLKMETIQLLVYSDPYLVSEYGYVMVEVLINQKNGKSYILENEIQDLKKSLGAKCPDIRAFEEVRQKWPVQKLMNNNFVWPSTDLKGGYSSEENTNFKEESELKKLGYQITNTSREKRWKVLETAVKQLGLRQVAYTIAQNVKLRKGQKGGEKKFSYAIGEWEHDLHKLKVTYYKHDFTWPNT